MGWKLKAVFRATLAHSSLLFSLRYRQGKVSGDWWRGLYVGRVCGQHKPGPQALVRVSRGDGGVLESRASRLQTQSHPAT